MLPPCGHGGGTCGGVCGGNCGGTCGGLARVCVHSHPSGLVRHGGLRRMADVQGLGVEAALTASCCHGTQSAVRSVDTQFDRRKRHQSARPRAVTQTEVCARRRANAGDRRSHTVWDDAWRTDRSSGPERLEVVQCWKPIVPNDAVPEDARNAHVPCPQAMPPLSMAGARDLHLFGSVQCK